jgi:hypothetical protein
MRFTCGWMIPRSLSRSKSPRRDSRYNGKDEVVGVEMLYLSKQTSNLKTLRWNSSRCRIGK